MSKRNAVRLISLTVALIVVIIGMAISAGKKNNYYELQLENEYSRAVDELTEGVNNIATLLKKSEYISGGEKAGEMAAEIVTEAVLSKNALSRLPFSGRNLDKLNKFLSQVGNYAVFVSKGLAENGTISESQRENMQFLSETAQSVSKIINDASAKFNNIEYWNSELEGVLPDENMSTAMDSIEQELSDYPTLIYDGPYSDHILEAQPQMTANAKAVTEQKAKQSAAMISGVEEEKLKSKGTASGHIDTFVFGNDDLSVTVSRFGGFPVYMRRTRAIDESHIDYEQALKKAKRFLDETGHTSLIETYYYTDEGVCVINFACLDGETVCYPDLIKVGVAMDSGDIMLYEASGYLSNHKARAFQSPKYTVEQAQQTLSDNLTVKETSIALIPTESGEERCYEFLCRGTENEEILVYIGVSDLKEKDILLLLKQDGGILVK